MKRMNRIVNSSIKKLKISTTITIVCKDNISLYLISFKASSFAKAVLSSTVVILCSIVDAKVYII